jgi:hypothetical protein
MVAEGFSGRPRLREALRRASRPYDQRVTPPRPAGPRITSLGADNFREVQNFPEVVLPSIRRFIKPYMQYPMH